VPLGKLLPGGIFSVNSTLQDAEVRDPITGAKRDISSFPENELTAELRQDIAAAKLAWGLHFESQSANTDYGLREIDSFRQLRMLNAFVETTFIEGFKIKLAANNITGDTERRDRQFYLPDRNEPLALRELSHFRPGTWWTLTASSTF